MVPPATTTALASLTMWENWTEGFNRRNFKLEATRLAGIKETRINKSLGKNPRPNSYHDPYKSHNLINTKNYAQRQTFPGDDDPAVGIHVCQCQQEALYKHHRGPHLLSSCRGSLCDLPLLIWLMTLRLHLLTVAVHKSIQLIVQQQN